MPRISKTTMKNRNIINLSPKVSRKEHGDMNEKKDYPSNFLIRMALLTPPNPAEIERPSLTSFLLAWLGT
jgi:hypothetical protein